MLVVLATMEHLCSAYTAVTQEVHSNYEAATQQQRSGYAATTNNNLRRIWRSQQGPATLKLPK